MGRRLLEAAINGDTMELDRLLQEDSRILDREMSKCEKEGKDNPVHIAATYGHVDFVREILSRKWEFTCQLNSQGQSPLHLATARGHVEVVKEILSKDADACFIRDEDGMIPLHLAAIKGRLGVLETLVEAKKMTAFILTKSGEPILHLCAKNNQTIALMMLVNLVDNDNFLQLKDSDDNTILHVIMQANNQSRQALVPYLLEKGVLDVNA
ncbi:Ankyrin repeat [Cinnamomum micranthum f. kanehirae]|uniref:Ankyrin repeat n=1 Tax=Cinnamomum micranthum f. kanehirae TaxID=337451 RepID=A0A3S4P138_9MAGN|nr:Ankyrin repeat [Cinnamomum micranthum f. kanehirae]